MYKVLLEKYLWSRDDARQFSEFLLPMLEYDPTSRSTAAQSLNHVWLK